MVATESIEFVIDPNLQVDLFGGRKGVSLREVSLGKEFVSEGLIWQSSTNLSTYGCVPERGRFRYNDRWFERADDRYTAYEIEPNVPFGPKGRVSRTFDLAQKVTILQVTYRGTTN